LTATQPGLGKSTLLIDIAARVTSHGMQFNNQQGPTGTVMLMSAEDPAESTIRPRLEAAGANVERIVELTEVPIGPDRCPRNPRRPASD
jgi:hypothetical protein